MFGVLDLSPIGILFFGGVFAILMIFLHPSLPHPLLMLVFRQPIVSFLVGVGIAYLLDDINITMTISDIITLGGFILALIYAFFYVVTRWTETRKDVERLNKELEKHDERLSKLENEIVDTKLKLKDLEKREQ